MEKSFPLNDTEYLADDLQMWFAGRTHGVLSTEDNLSVIPREGMKISMSTGHAFLKTGNPNKGGIMYYNEAPKDFIVDVADSVLNRIDSVVIRYDKVQNTVSAYLKKGIPGSTPAAYVPIRDAEAFELVIAEISVQHGIGAITASLIKDTRMDEQKCGLVRDNIERIPTQVLYDQFQDFMDVNESEFNSVLETARNDYEEIKKDSEDQVKIVFDKIEELDNMVMNGDFDGASILSGLDDPMDDIGKDKDLYVNESTYHLFLKENGAWIDKGSLRGVDGDNKVFAGADLQNAIAKTLLMKTEDLVGSVDHITLETILDTVGNAAVASDTSIIKHADQNLEDFINKRVYKVPEGYEFSDTGTILLKNIDVNTVIHPGWYYCDTCTGLPTGGSYYMEIAVHPSSDGYITQHVISVNAGHEFTRNRVGGTWGEWLLTAGEILLWSGNLVNAGDIAISMPVSRFQTLVLETTSGYTLIASHKDRASFRFTGTSVGTSERIMTVASAYMTKKSSTVLTNVCPAMTVILKANTAVTTAGLTLTKLIGRP